MVCNFLSQHAVLKGIRKYFGTNVSEFIKVANKVFKNETESGELEFTNSFIKWWNDNYKNEPLDIKTITPTVLKNRMLKYYKYAVPSYSNFETSANSDSNSVQFGYTSTVARKEAKASVARSIYVQYFNNEASKGEAKPTNNLSKYATNYIIEIKKRLARILAEETGKNVKEIFENIKTNNPEYLNSILTDETPITTLNLVALFKEMTSTFAVRNDDGTVGKSPQVEFFEEVMMDKTLSTIKTSKEDNFNQIDNEVIAGEVEKTETSNSIEDVLEHDDTDGTIRDLNNHHGELSDYKGHITERIRYLLNTIPKLNSTRLTEDGKLDFNLDNAIGLPSYMDATEISTNLYSYLSRDDKESMLESIKVLAESMPGQAGLIRLYNILKSNTDILHEFFTVFGKHPVPKAQTIVSDNLPFFRKSNTSTNKLETLRNEYIRSYIYACTNIDIKSITDKLNILEHGENGRYNMTIDGQNVPLALYLVRNATGKNEITDGVVHQLYNLITNFFPSVSLASFENYIYQPGKTPFQTINEAYSDLKLAIKKASDIQSKQRKKDIDIKNAIINNRKKLETNLKAETDPTIKPYLQSDFEDVDTLTKEEVIEAKDLASPMSFAEHMMDYVMVKTNMNSLNVHGNQSSDILNSSLITRLKSVFESRYNIAENNTDGQKSPLQLFAEDYHLDETTQFKLSNILIEQDGHAGLFRKDKSGKFVPTEYATQLIEFTLFNGANNEDTDTPVLYNEMSKGDYIGTAWINYFDKTETTLGNTDFKLGRYFLRIPSDAPKTFIIKAPRYAITSQNPLFNTANIEEFDNFVSNVFNELRSKQADFNNIQHDLLESQLDEPYIDKEFARQILSTWGLTLYLPKEVTGDLDQLSLKKDDDVRIAIKHSMYVNGKIVDIPYVMRGKYNSKQGTLTDASFDGFLFINNEQAKGIENLLNEELNKDFESKGYVEYNGNRINRKRNVIKSHQLFRQLKAAFKQELLDGISAAKLMFETELKTKIIDGREITKHVIKRDSNGNPILKEKWAKDTNGLSLIYHVNEDGVAFKEGKLLGRVFTSDRFIIFDENDNIIRNYGQELIDEVVSYINDSSVDNLVDWIEDGDHLVDLNLSQEQEDAIDSKLQEYINDFVDSSIERLEDSKNFIKGTNQTIDNIADFMLNHQIMYINSNELLEGDTKYYKDTQDFLKRTKEYQASGNPYALASTRRTLSTPMVKLGNIGWGIERRDRFNAITIKNTITHDKGILDNLVDVLSNKKIMGERAMTKQEAKEHIYGKDGKGGYTNTTVNDAQSYITFEEWIRRVDARGELDKYRSLIDRIMNNEPLSISDIDTFIQVQKNIYFDMYFDEKIGRVAPRQIKNAEFVLIPQFVEGTELETLYDFMRENDIDQLNTRETSKASNSYVLEIFDEKTGTLKKDAINAAEPNKAKKFKDKVKEAIQPYSYNYLYEQQRTSQHLNTTNKLAIQIAKKVIDNIDSSSELYPVKERYFQLLATNIRESFVSLMKELNVPVDKNGNIDTSNPDAFRQIDYEKFNNRLREELSRIGVDDNTIDYVTMSDDPLNPGTIMPNYFGIMINKLESISQAIINRNITRQTLTGFHAAQITAVGFAKLGTKKRIGVDKTLAYHPVEWVNEKTSQHISEEEYKKLEDKTGFEKKTQHYIEVMLPYSAFGIDKNSEHYKNMSDEDIIKELEAKGLDKFIGYRIPTEGKQSISVMKIKRFIHDELGSTIVVPDEWVSQTGSDFDIDSIYGIQMKSYVGEDGAVHIIEYTEDYNELYKRYVFDNLTKKQKDEIFEHAKLDADTKKAIKERTKNDSYDVYINILEDIKSDKLNKAVEFAAKQAGLESFEEFSKRDVMSANSKAARDNEIVKCMLTIMSSDLSLEENLSRSNFDDIVNKRNGAVDLLRSKVESNRRKGRSPFNFLDEADMQEDAMQGYALKGFSVMRDTFCSICNTVKPTISDKFAIWVDYDYTHLSDKEFEKKLKEIESTFQYVINKGKIITVKHNTIGWSYNNNKNIDGKYITIYTAETTAHILDAMKSGPVPNVNLFTFGVYKTLVDVGSNYMTAVGFIMQPAINTINKHYNSSNSIYSDDNDKHYLDAAIRDYLKKLLVKGNVKSLNKWETTDSFLNVVSNQYKELIQKMFGDISFTTSYADNNLPPIDSKSLEERLVDEDSFAVKYVTDKFTKEDVLAIYDLVNVLQFGKINALVNHIDSIQHLTNPDKFGAKQSIFDAERVFRRLDRYVRNQYSYSEKENSWINHSALSVKGKDILEAIYPGFVNINSASNVDGQIEGFISSVDNIKNSKYPILCSHLKFGTATSIIINRNLFATQTPQFRKFIYDIERMFSDTQTLDEATYKNLRSYVINALYKKLGFINSNLNWKEGIGYDYKYGNVDNPNLTEYARVYGYGHGTEFIVQNEEEESKNLPGNTKVEVLDVNEPTEKELNLFCKLSPAQKIEFIRNKFYDESVFDYIETRLDTTINTKSARSGAQLISFVESSADIDYLRNLFYKAFNSINPLVKLTAIDIVKYAFVVDGYSFGRNGISKIIPNSILLNNDSETGTSIVSDMNELVSTINLHLNQDVLENFIRSHSNLRQINKRTVKKVKGEWELTKMNKGIIIVPSVQLETAKKYGIISDNKVNSYVRLKFGKNDKETLYKINIFSDETLYLYPINDLEYNECSLWSANERNNRYPSSDGITNYYDYIIRQYRSGVAENITTIDKFKLQEIIGKTNDKSFYGISYNKLRQEENKVSTIRAKSLEGKALVRAATEAFNNIFKGYSFMLVPFNFDKYLDKGSVVYELPVYMEVEGKEELSAPRYFKISKRDIEDVYEHYAYPRKDRSKLSEEQLDLIKFLEDRTDYNYVSKKFSRVVKVEEVQVVPESHKKLDTREGRNFSFSTVAAGTSKVNPITKAASAVVTGVNYLGSITNNEDVQRLQQSFKSSKITAKEKVAEQHIEEIIIPASKVIKKAVDEIENKLQRYMPIPDKKGEYYPITHPAVIAEVKKSDTKEEEYLKAIMDPGAIESKFAIFRDFNIDAEDTSLRPYLETIKSAVGRLAKLPILKEAKENYVYQIIDKLSDNPEIVSQAMSVVDGFYKQSRLNALFNDIGEAPNALVQVMMKRIINNLEARKQQARRDIDMFVAHCDDIRKRAAADGMTINNDNIFDDYGRFKRKYKDKLIEDRDKLQRIKDDANLHWLEMKKKHGELSVESVNAFLDLRRKELEYEEWKAKHLEQEALNEANDRSGITDLGYYNSKNAATRAMLYNEETKYIFAVYEILRKKRNDIRNKIQENVENEALDEQLDDITDKIESLKRGYILDDVTYESIRKKSYSETSSDVEEMIRRAWNDEDASKALNDYATYISQIENKYYAYNPKYGFKQQVEDNLAIIRNAEQPDSRGIPTTPAYKLAKDEEYKKAKRWMRRNAQHLYLETGDDSWIQEYRWALETLSDDPKSHFGITYKDILYRKGNIDENGDIDGIKISENPDDVRKIKEAQDRNFGNSKENYFSDRRLINVALSDRLVYTDSYWEGVSGGKRGADSKDNKLWQDTIEKINNLLAPYYVESSNSIDWTMLIENNTEEEAIDILVSLNNLYDVLDNIPKRNGTDESVKKFIEDNCESIINEDRLNADLMVANSITKSKLSSLLRQTLTGHSKTEKAANRYLYVSFGLKHKEGTKEYDKFVDKDKTKAKHILEKYTYKTLTKYYYQAREEAMNAGKPAFREWYLANHVYNPYTRKFDPIAIWTKTAINGSEGSGIVDDYAPKYPQTMREVRAGQGDIKAVGNVIEEEEVKGAKEYKEERDFRNKNYKPNVGHAENYKVGSNLEYDNPVTMNKYEQEMSEYLQNEVYNLVEHKENKENNRFVNGGWAPNRMAPKAADLVGIGKSVAELLGFTAGNTSEGKVLRDVSYASDRVLAMPLTTLLKTKDSEVNKLKVPYRENFETEEEYIKSKQKYDAEEARIRKQNLEIHKAVLDRDFETVIKDFIMRGSKYNATQHAKYLFYITLDLLNEYGVYMQQHDISGDFITDSKASNDESSEYIKRIDKQMVEQFETIIQRHVFNEWKAPHGALVRWMNVLQSITSAKFMMLNFKGGVANVTYGEASIHSESMARSYFNEKESIGGLMEYNSGIIDYMAHAYSDKSSTEAGAIIKQFDVVDYDEHEGIGHVETDLNKIVERVKNLAYSPQSAGEHAMQNRVLLAMLRSHRLFINPRFEEFNQPKYTFMNLAEYTQNLQEEALKELLATNPPVGRNSAKLTFDDYLKFKEDIRSDANKYKNYAWFQKSYVTSFVQSNFNYDKQAEFNKTTEELAKKAKEEFYNDEVHPTLRSQLGLGDDGKMTFKEGSLLKDRDKITAGRNVSESLQLIADFKGRVVSVNKKIHGSYDKMGRAKIENNWFGGVLMQYRKHIPIGLSKRYRSKGYFNEARGSVEIGSYNSLYRFLSIPFKKHQSVLELSDEEVEAGVGLQNMIKELVNFAFNWKTAYNTMPEYDKANIRRVCADFQAMFAALFACIVLKMLAGGDDDDKDSWWYNFAFYQTDRLASEASQYMPWVLPQEARKNFRTPMAGFNGIDDLMNTASFFTQMVFGGEDFSPVYESGVNAGRNKLDVYIQRNIPLWRGVRSSFVDIKDNNKAYKAGKNVLGFIDTDATAERLNKTFGFK